MFGLIQHKIKRPLALLLAAMLVLLSLNNSYFMHAHRLADGSIVHHAHPFNTQDDAEPIKSHHHSAVEMVLLNSLQFFVFLFAIGFLLLIVERPRRFFISASIIIRQDCYIHLNGRAPPANFIFSMA